MSLLQQLVLLLLPLLTLQYPRQTCAVNWCLEQGPLKLEPMQQHFALQLLMRHEAVKTVDQRQHCFCYPTIVSTIRRRTFLLHHPISIRIDAHEIKSRKS